MKDQSNIGAKVTTRNDFFEDAADALLMEISKMPSVSGVPFEGQTQIYMSRPEVATTNHNDIETEILDGLCPADKEQFRADDRLGLGRNRTNERNGDAAPLDAQVEDEALRRATINGEVPSEIADTGASATCVQQANEQVQVSECGKYGWTGSPFF